MANKAERVKEQVQIQEVLDNHFLESLGELGQKPSPAKQSKYIKSILEEVKRSQNVDACKNIMRPCGYQCISGNIIVKAKDLYLKAGQKVEVFLELLNKEHIGGGNLTLQDDAIIGSYEFCYCGIPKSVKNLPKEYCECSAGWFERLFSEVFERKVEVIIIQTFLSGGDKCIFKITY
ncbi:MAG TPA: DUF6144 family protein [Mobilitalea sp.]|nr:DUF6144 family protein [Mobilitalea sp.]